MNVNVLTHEGDTTFKCSVFHRYSILWKILNTLCVFYSWDTIVIDIVTSHDYAYYLCTVGPGRSKMWGCSCSFFQERSESSYYPSVSCHKSLLLTSHPSPSIPLQCVLVTQSCPTLCEPLDCGPPGSSVHGILQARVIEWVAISSSMGSSWLRAQTQVSCIAGRFFTIWAALETPTSPTKVI